MSKQRDMIMQAAMKGIGEMLKSPSGGATFGTSQVQLFQRDKGKKPPVLRVIDDKANVYEIDMVEY
jgi:hypothetical protein